MAISQYACLTLNPRDGDDLNTIELQTKVFSISMPYQEPPMALDYRPSPDSPLLRPEALNPDYKCIQEFVRQQRLDAYRLDGRPQIKP